METLGERMKSFEKTDSAMPYESIVVRADGKNFSKFTKNFEKPYDHRFISLMIQTSEELLDYFQASTVYVQSDEITLIFPRLYTKAEYEALPEKMRQNHIFNGRISKLESLIASKAGVSFNLALIKQGTTFKGPAPIFDARAMIFSESQDEEVVNNLIWRSEYDSKRNTILNYGCYILGHKKIHGMKQEQIIEALKEVNFDFEKEVPLELLYGVFLKKERQIGHAGVMRTGIKNFTVRLTLVQDRRSLIFSKYYD